MLIVARLAVVSILQHQRQEIIYYLNSSKEVSSVAQLYPTLCDPMNHSMPGLRVHHQLPEFTQTPVH